MRWMDIVPRIPVNILLTYIPVLATLVTCYFSVVLTRATLRYVAATDKGLALAREEFEREWSPELHLKFERVSSSEVRIVVTNLAKQSVLLQLLQIRKVDMLVPFERCELNEPLVGGLTWTQELGKRLLACTGDDFEGQIAACMTFFASGRMFRTDWFRFRIQVERGRVIRLDSSNIPARRVRVLTNRQGVERRKELVQDVAAGTGRITAPDEVHS
jgi:cell division protein FtsL